MSIYVYIMFSEASKGVQCYINHRFVFASSKHITDWSLCAAHTQNKIQHKKTHIHDHKPSHDASRHAHRGHDPNAQNKNSRLFVCGQYACRANLPGTKSSPTAARQLSDYEIRPRAGPVPG